MVCFQISGGIRAVGGGLDTYSAQVLIGEVLSCRSEIEDIHICLGQMRKKTQGVERKLKNIMNVLGRV